MRGGQEISARAMPELHAVEGTHATTRANLWLGCKSFVADGDEGIRQTRNPARESLGRVGPVGELFGSENSGEIAGQLARLESTI